jgi:Fe-S-cluster containining protein
MPADLDRHQPTCFPCFGDPEVKALAAAMQGILREVLTVVEDHADRFARNMKFPKTTFALFHRFRTLYDRFLQEVLGRSGLKVTCSAGCPACCHALPWGVEPLELMDIYAAVRPRNDFKNIIKKSLKAIEILKKTYLQVMQESGRAEGMHADLFAVALSRFALHGMPCAFLNQHRGTCTIYPVRPIICRSVFSLSHPRQCEPKHPDYPRRKLEIIEPVDEINYVLIQINGVISEALGVRFPDVLQHGLLFWHGRITAAFKGV